MASNFETWKDQYKQRIQSDHALDSVRYYLLGQLERISQIHKTRNWFAWFMGMDASQLGRIKR